MSPGTLAFQAYGRRQVSEQFACQYGLNPLFRDRIEGGPLRVAGVGPEDEIRIVELSGHPFFVATLFVPQLSSSAHEPHPLIALFLGAAMAFRAAR